MLPLIQKGKGCRKKVIKLEQIEYIKYLYEVEGESLRGIAKRCKLNYRTVEKYAKQVDWNETQPPIKKEKYPVLGGYIEIIDNWLENDKKEPRKQRHTIQRIHTRLVVEHGFTGGYGSVKRYVRKKRETEKRNKEATLPLAHPKAQAQIDFGSFKYYDANKTAHTGNYLTMTFPYSNAGFTQVFKGENQECLLEGMKRIFTHIGGIPEYIKFDNLSAVVVKILSEGERILTEGFRRFMLHYRFQSQFCNPQAGNEKGSVENKIGYSRRNFFVPVPTIADFEIYNKALLTLCDEDHDRNHYQKQISIMELWVEEQKELFSLPENDYQVFRYESARIDNTGFIKVDTNRYGINPEFAGKLAQLKIFHDKIEIYHDRHLLKTYERSYNTNEEIGDWKSYIGLLRKKPGGLEHMRYFDQIPKLWKEYLTQTKGKERKSALMLLTEIINEDKLDEGIIALEIANLYGRNDVASIRQCYFSLNNGEFNPDPIVFDTEVPMLVFSPDLSIYDNLTSDKEGSTYEQNDQKIG